MIFLFPVAMRKWAQAEICQLAFRIFSFNLSLVRQPCHPECSLPHSPDFLGSAPGSQQPCAEEAIMDNEWMMLLAGTSKLQLLLN